MPAKRILLVEDDADVRVLMEHVLIGDGYQVDPVSTVGAARTLLGRTRYDLVLADAVLPDGSGIEVAGEAEARGLPVIVVTAYAFRLPKRDMARYELLLKPLRPAELLAAVERTVGKAPCD
jgi:DNA-binding response OmpR family regulator